VLAAQVEHVAVDAGIDVRGDDEVVESLNKLDFTHISESASQKT
jgi:hypothetical protein